MKQLNPYVKAWYIDPYTETIQLIETTDSLTDLAKWVGTYEIVFFAQQENGDALLIGADAARMEFTTVDNDGHAERIPRAPAWQFVDTSRIFYGRALWVNLSPTHGLQSPYCTKKWLEHRIDFWGFTNVVDILEDDTAEDIISHLPDDEDYFTDYMNQSGEDADDED